MRTQATLLWLAALEFGIVHYDGSSAREHVHTGSMCVRGKADTQEVCQPEPRALQHVGVGDTGEHWWLGQGWPRIREIQYGKCLRMQLPSVPTAHRQALYRVPFL